MIEDLTVRLKALEGQGYLMKENVGSRDRQFRITLGVILVVLGGLGYAGLIPVANIFPQALTSVALSGTGTVLVLTGYFRRCMIYRIFGVDTSE